MKPFIVTIPAAGGAEVTCEFSEKETAEEFAQWYTKNGWKGVKVHDLTSECNPDFSQSQQLSATLQNIKQPTLDSTPTL
jgi:hypothetical protein